MIQHCSSKEEGQHFDKTYIEDLKGMDNYNNVFVQLFGMAKDRLATFGFIDLKQKLIGGSKIDGEPYNLPIVVKIIGLIVIDVGFAGDGRDIIVEFQSGILKRINELLLSYLV